MDRVAVVILNWNGEQMLQTFLPSVVEYSQGEGVAVYVADNGSTDNSVKVIQEQFPSVRLICFTENYGFAEGYNKAIKEVYAEYVVLLNSDVEVTAHWLEPMISYLDAHPNVAACQPKLRSWRDKNSFEYAGASGGFIDGYGYPFCRGRMLSVVEQDCGQYDDIVPIFWATGAALTIRKDVYQEVGGLDGSFFAHMEEIDLCWRLRSRGYGIVVVPQSVVFHVGAATLKKESPRKTFLNFRNNLLMLYKNLPPKELNKVMRMRCLLDYLAILQFFLKGEVANAKAVWKARKEFHQKQSEYAHQREENLKLSVQDVFAEKMNFLLPVQFYLKGKKKYSDISLTHKR